jgi:4-hydroxybenzoate polyprenyltransferase
MVRRWWAYQRERFPVRAHGVLIAAFSLSAVGYASLLQGRPELPVPAAVVAFVSSFLFFLQLRVADEFKDFEEDCRYRPDRPVPRGLVSLKELGLVAALAAIVQLALAVWLDPRLLLPLMAAWAYLGLMTVEFFAPARLRVQSALYLATHLVILPLVALYATACVWVPAGQIPPGLGWFLGASYGTGAVLEVGRKVRAPEDERPGVGSYTAHWGRPGAMRVWLVALMLTGGCAAVAAWHVGFLLPVAGVLVALLVTAAGIAGRFLRAPDTGGAKRVEAFSGVWTLLVYVSVGIAPVGWHRWSFAPAGSP